MDGSPDESAGHPRITEAARRGATTPNSSPSPTSSTNSPTPGSSSSEQGQNPRTSPQGASRPSKLRSKNTAPTERRKPAGDPGPRALRRRPRPHAAHHQPTPRPGTPGAEGVLPGTRRPAESGSTSSALSSPFALRRDYPALRPAPESPPSHPVRFRGRPARTQKRPRARVAAQHDPLSKARYRALRARGFSHGRALRTVGDRLLAAPRHAQKRHPLRPQAGRLPPEHPPTKKGASE